MITFLAFTWSSRVGGAPQARQPFGHTPLENGRHERGYFAHRIRIVRTHSPAGVDRVLKAAFALHDFSFFVRAQPGQWIEYRRTIRTRRYPHFDENADCSIATVKNQKIPP